MFSLEKINRQSSPLLSRWPVGTLCQLINCSWCVTVSSCSRCYTLVIGFPEGGPRADVGEYGDLMGTLQQISAHVVGEMWGFFNALLSGENLGTSLLFNWEEIGNDRLLARSMVRWRRRRRGYVLKSIVTAMFFVYQTDRHTFVRIWRQKQL